jgi:hypothetical protein
MTGSGETIIRVRLPIIGPRLSIQNNRTWYQVPNFWLILSAWSLLILSLLILELPYSIQKSILICQQVPDDTLSSQYMTIYNLIDCEYQFDRLSLFYVIHKLTSLNWIDFEGLCVNWGIWIFSSAMTLFYINGSFGIRDIALKLYHDLRAVID